MRITVGMEKIDVRNKAIKMKHVSERTVKAIKKLARMAGASSAHIKDWFVVFYDEHGVPISAQRLASWAVGKRVFYGAILKMGEDLGVDVEKIAVTTAYTPLAIEAEERLVREFFERVVELMLEAIADPEEFKRKYGGEETEMLFEDLAKRLLIPPEELENELV